MPKKSRHTKRPAKFFAAAWLHNATDHTKMLMLEAGQYPTAARWPQNAPHPFPDRKALQAEVLRKLEQQITEIEDCPQPVVSDALY